MQVNWEKTLNQAQAIYNLTHPKISDDEDENGLLQDEYDVQMYIKGLRELVNDYIDQHPIPHNYTITAIFTPVYYLDNSFGDDEYE